MMKYEPPVAVTLTAEETDLAARVKFDLNDVSGEDARAMLTVASELAKSSMARSAVPARRMDYFLDAALNVGASKSRKEVFESNGTRGEAILRHPHFLPYLRYFIHGPDLPVASVQGFCKILNDDAGTSGMVMDQL